MSESAALPYKPEGKQIFYVEDDNIFLVEAKKIMLESSTDKRHSTGAVIVKNEKIIASGANKSALKNLKLIELHKNWACIRRLFKIKSGEKYWLCPGCASCKLHAEFRAVADAQKNNIDTKDADLYLWGHWWCCKPCWDKMLEAGIKNVYLAKEAYEKFGDNKK